MKAPQRRINSENEADDKEVLENEDHDPRAEILYQNNSKPSEELVRGMEAAAQQAVVRRSQTSTAGVTCYDEAFDWNLMNVSVKWH